MRENAGRIATATIAVAAGAALVYYLRRRRTRTRLPLVTTDKKGDAVTVRLAVAADRAQVAESIADQSGTGSGIGNDDFLLQEFDRMVADPTATVLFVDGADGKGLGMMVVMWSNASESYCQSLRVAEAARGRGVAAILFRAAAKLAVERQGEHSISRWGVVSNNTIMTKWSQRLGLHGPQLFRRHSAPAAPDAPSLPPGYVFRAATAADIPLLWPRLASFPVATSEFGSQNFVASGWATFDEEALTAGVAKQLSRGIPMPQPRLLLDARGELVAFASIAHLRFGERFFLMHRYADGTPEGLALLVHMLPALAHELGCHTCGGYVPTLPWILEIYEASPVYERATATEQWEFHWRNVDFANLAC